MKRLRYVLRLIYWALRLHSISRARWVLAYEGTTW